MSRIVRRCMLWLQRWHLSLFEKVIFVNSIMLIGEALVGLWVTSHNVEAEHYLIDTSFIVIATLLTLFTNIILLRASFRPLFNLLATIRSVSKGKTEARAQVASTDSEISELANAFNAMLDQLETARREQTLLILQAQEEERRRIALELHDETGQSLTALLIHTEVLSQGLQNISDTSVSPDIRVQLNEGLAYLTKLTQSTLENIRVLSQQLRPSVLDDLGLQAAFRWLAEDGRQRLQLTIALKMEGFSDSPTQHHLPAVYETTLFRIAQESLTNVARHAHAQHVSISLIQEQQAVSLRIEDDGCGYDPLQQHTGLGVFGMRERAALLGGTLFIRSQPGQGTIIEACLPFTPHTSRNENHDYASQ